MNIEQKQHLLAFLGLYTGIVDGIWGPKSQAAMNLVREKYESDDDIVALMKAVADWEPNVTDNNVGNKSFWGEIEFFDREEFRCQCKGKHCDGFPTEPEEDLVRACNEIRRRLGVPISIVDAGGSGVRCKHHNAAVGGAVNSNHLYGKAADLHSEKSPQEMYRVANEVLGNTGELGLYSWGIHVGVNCKYSRFTGK